MINPTSASAAILVLNAGSSSLKAKLLCQREHSNELTVLWQGQRTWRLEQPDAATALLEDWLAAELNPWRSAIALVGHRVVHGGERFTAATRLDDTVLAAIAALAPLAPLHNAPSLQVMRWSLSWLPQAQQWACFDTAFHATLPPAQHTYAIPATWRAQGLRRFGFHGLNHQHIAETIAAIRHEEDCSEAELRELRLISCHLGAGCSLCAIRGGRSVATTMGMTPMEGLVMATRSGSVDPGLLLHLLRHEGLDAEALDEALNHHSGLLGLSGLSGDMRELRQAAAAGHANAQLAIDVFTARLLESIGAMAAALGGVDVIALSGGIGQNDEVLAHALHQKLQWLGPFRLLQIPADEEAQIARQCLKAAGQLQIMGNS